MFEEMAQWNTVRLLLCGFHVAKLCLFICTVFACLFSLIACCVFSFFNSQNKLLIWKTYSLFLNKHNLSIALAVSFQLFWVTQVRPNILFMCHCFVCIKALGCSSDFSLLFSALRLSSCMHDTAHMPRSVCLGGYVLEAAGMTVWVALERVRGCGRWGPKKTKENKHQKSLNEAQTQQQSRRFDHVQVP